MLYNYHCQECKHEFEKNLPMKDNDLPESEPCPECGKIAVTQMVDGAGNLHSGRGMQRPDEGFREVLAKVAENHPAHKMNMR